MNNEQSRRPKRKKGNKLVTKETNLEEFLEKRATTRNDGETMVNLKDCEFDSWITFKSCIRLIFQSSSIDNTCCCRALNVSGVRVLSSSCEEEEENNNNNSSLFLESLFDDEKEEEKKKEVNNNVLERLREMNVSGNEKAFRSQKGCAKFVECLRRTRNVRLERLNASSCDVDDAFVESLLSSPSSLKRLRVLNLRNNKRLTDRTIDAVLRFCEDMGSSCVLTDVNCSGGTFSAAAIGRLGEALERNAVGYLRRRLKKEGEDGFKCNDSISNNGSIIDASSGKGEGESEEVENQSNGGSTTKSVSNCNVTDGIFMRLFEDIVILKNVIAVDVRNNNITENGFKHFFEKFSVHCCEEENNDASFSSPLQLMCDGNPGFSSSWCKRLLALCAFHSLYEKCRQNRKGEAMRSLGEVGFGCAGCEVIAPRILRRMPFLESIGLHHNDINDEGCAHLSELFAKHNCVLEVALYGNKIGPIGAQSIVDAFTARAKERLSGYSSIRGLEILDIGGNPIGSAGVRLIAKLITLEETLVEVHVDHVGFNEEGAHELLRAMEMRLNNGQPMRTIWAHGNDISDDFLTSLTNLCRNRHGNAAIDGGISDEDDCDHDDTSHTQYQPKPDGVWDAQECETRALEATKRGDNTDATARLKSNRIASHAFGTYKRYCKRHYENAKGAACFAAFVAYEKSTSRVKVASLGVGTKFVPPDVAGSAFVSSRDDVIRDSHAEILARRNFLRYLYAEMNDSVAGGKMESSGAAVQYNDDNNFSVLEMNDGWFRKRDDVEIHLYVSSAPCGSASLNLESSLNCFPHATRKGTNVFSADNTIDDEKVPPGCVVLRGGVREAIGNPKQTLSCSDKIAIWCARGVQGSILTASFIKEPIVLSSVSCSRKYDGDRLFEATYGRTCCSSPSLNGKNYENKAMKNLCTQMASISIEFKERSVRARADVGESDESVSWCAYDTIARVHDGRTGLAISGRGKPPRASKYDLKMQFLKLVSSIVKVDTSSSIAKAKNGCSFVHGDDFTSVSLLKKRLQDSYAFARNAEETHASSPYAKFKETVLRGDGKAASVSFFLERDCVNVAWRDGTAG